MTLYSGTTDPYSHRCRIVLFEKGMDFEVIDVDLSNKPEDLAVINPHNTVHNGILTVATQMNKCWNCWMCLTGF